MEDEKSVLKFDLTSKQIKFRNILNKEFLELEIYAISDEDPNRNGSHFTLSSIKKIVENNGCKNKPIVGFFEKGDFTTHEGEASYDPELDNEYWDTTHGERILGWIRESDPVEIVEKDGLHWLKFRCILCVNYCYAQVKRLLKDRRKKVSVEITINSGKKREDGIYDIEDFTLNGTTILGSKNGKEVLEGIPGANLSILENLDDEAMMEQKKALSFAYEQIDSKAVDNKSANEDKFLGERTFSEPERENSGKEETVNTMEQNEAIENKEVEKEACGNENEACENKENESCDKENESCGNENCEDKELTMIEGNDVVEGQKDNESCDEGKEENEACGEQKESCGEQKEDCGCEGEGDDDKDDDDEEMCKMQARVQELESKCEEYEAKLKEYEDYSAIKERMEKAEEKVHEYFCNEMKNYAVSIMENEHIAKADYDAIVDKCISGKYSSQEDIKRDVAYAAYNARPAENKRFTASITAPDMSNCTEDKLKNMTREERIAARCQNKK